MPRPLIVYARTVVAVALISVFIWFVHRSYRWPLLGDAQIFHYNYFLMQHGFYLYRDIPDLNMPGTYENSHYLVTLPGIPGPNKSGVLQKKQDSRKEAGHPVVRTRDYNHGQREQPEQRENRISGAPDRGRQTRVSASS
ncbi:MAG TPA: hypothetical protein VH164_09205 [Ktedonobacteraceae bacterium]|nr:hypothetical protein [Ktedonobacteraceae bacterium]